MKQTLKFVIILCFFAYNATAQCVDQFLTTTPTVNIWDWRGTPATPTTPANTNWQIRYINTSGQITPLSIKSPFFETRNDNTFPIAFLAEKEYQPTDGWELVAKNVGTVDSTDDDEPSNSPYVILYNKNTARLRVFLLVVQLFSEVGSAGTYQPGGFIKVQFKDDSGIPYQSNLLTTNTSPMLPLDKFERNLNMVMVNSFTSATPYWLYTDVPVAYDPCTCLNKGILLIKGSINQGADVNLEIHSVPQTSPIDANGNTDKNGFLKGFSDVSNYVKGGFEAGKNARDNIVKLQESIDKNFGLNTRNPKLGQDLITLGNAVDLGLGFVSMIPEVGGVVSSVVSLVDYFVSGGKASKGSSPSGVVIMNDFKATGTITTPTEKTTITLAIPGSDQSTLDNSLKPIYNNTLGIFNLLRTPKATVSTTPSVLVTGLPIPASKVCGRGGSLARRYTDLYVKLDRNTLNEVISYVVNPAIYPDLELSDIRAAIQIAGLDSTLSSNMVAETRTNVTLANGTVKRTNLYRTEYYPIGQMAEVTANIKGITTEYVTFCYTNQYLFAPVINLKIIARIKRKNTSKPEEDIIFIATYPVEYTPVVIPNNGYKS